jgi:hypothetical protein
MLTFLPTSDGFRVERNGLAVAALRTKDVDNDPPPVMPTAMYLQLQTDLGADAALKARDEWAEHRSRKVTCYKDLPRDQCTIHGCGGPLSVSDIDEMLAHLAK